MKLHEQVTVIARPEGWVHEFVCFRDLKTGNYRVWTHRAHRDLPVEDFEWALTQEPYRPHKFVYHPLEQFSHTVQELASTNTARRNATRARVRSVEAVYWKRESGTEFGPRIAGSAVVEGRERVTGQEPERDGVKFDGLYLVGLEPLEEPGKP